MATSFLIELLQGTRVLQACIRARICKAPHYICSMSLVPETLSEDSETDARYRDSSDNNDLTGVGTWASGAQSTSDKRGSGKHSSSKKSKMSASLERWVNDSQGDPWSHVTGGKSGKPAGAAGGKNSKA